MDNWGLVDTWRHKHTTAREYTCYAPTHGTYSRLDRILLTKDHMGSHVSTIHRARYLSDHAPVSCELVWGRTLGARLGWRMPVDMLEDAEGRRVVQDAVIEYLETNWGTTKTRNTEWEALKAVIRGRCMGLACGVRKTLQRELQEGERKLAKHQHRPVSDTIYAQTELDLQRQVLSTRERLEQYTLKTYRQLLHREGDTPSRLLAWIIKRESPRQTITHLVDLEGSEVYSQMEILNCLRVHLQRVYSSPTPASEGAVVEYLASLGLPHLEAETSRELDANLTVEELQIAMSLLPMGKAPGGDGLPAEFVRLCSPLLVQHLLQVYQ